jgi:hypothetical protein
MDDYPAPRSSSSVSTIGKRVIAWVIVAAVAIIALKLVVGAILGILTFVAVIAVIGAVIWAFRHL